MLEYVNRATIPPHSFYRCSADYYFDSYAHFGIHEVCMRTAHVTGC